jgi:hypothetical protein
MNKSLEIQFLVSSNAIQIKDIAKIKVGVKITNNGDQIQKIDISESELFVNGIKNRAWDLRVQNGAIINLAVHPKKTETVQWNLGKALFNTPGIYELELRWEFVSQKQKIVVSD